MLMTTLTSNTSWVIYRDEWFGQLPHGAQRRRTAGFRFIELAVSTHCCQS